MFNKPDFGCLYFAGAEYATEFTGYVEGAICSGEFVAQQILQGDDHPTRGKGIQYVKGVWDFFLFLILYFLVELFEAWSKIPAARAFRSATVPPKDR